MSDGFPLDPDSHLAPFLISHALSFPEIAHYPVLGLLGEPGMGKTTTMNVIAEATRRAGELVFAEDLALCGSEISLRDTLRDAKTLLSAESGRKLHVFFDGLDEGLRVSVNFVAVCLRSLRELPADRVCVRFACRSAEWPPDFEIGLHEIWGKDSVAVYQLMPLLRKDVGEAAEAAGIDGIKFLRSVDSVGASAFACRPIMLEFLLRSFEKGQGLSLSKPDLYRNGCLTLADESRHARRRQPRLSSVQRVAIAARIAAVTTLCERPIIWMGPRHTAPENELQVEDLCGGSEQFDGQVVHFNLDTIQETLETGLFCSKGPDQVAFAHQTYAEYLSAKFLTSKNLPPPEILKFVEHPTGSSKIVPQLRDVAMWLAEMEAAVCRCIISNDPEVLLPLEASALQKADRQTLVREILRRFESGDLVEEHIVRRMRVNLLDLDLASDVRPYLRGKNYPTSVRSVAVLLAERPQQTDLQREILQIALDETECCDLRATAVAAIGVIADARGVAKLKALLQSGVFNDPDDEIKGAVLTATWPHHLTAAEMFKALTTPKRSNFSGRYERFLSTDIASSLKRHDLRVALAWADQRNGHLYPEVDLLDATAIAIVEAAIEVFDEPGVSEQLAEVLYKRAQSRGIDSSIWVKLHENNNARRAIGLAAIRMEAVQSSGYRASADLLVTDDIEFLAVEFEKTNLRELREYLCAAIAQLLCRTQPATVGALERIIALMRTDATFAAFVSPVLAPIQLDSTEAQTQRKHFELMRLQTNVRRIVPNPPLDISDLLELWEGGRKDIFFEICFRLSQPRANWNSEDGVVPPRWCELPPAARAQTIRAAESYLRECRAPAPTWISISELPYAVIFGHWAFRLLLREAKSRFDALPNQTWYEWVFSAFGDPYKAVCPDPEEVMILQSARRRAPHPFLEALRAFIEGQSESIGTTYVIDRLVCTWDSEIAQCLRANLRDHQLTTQIFDLVLGRLIDAADQESIPIATEFIERTPHLTGDDLIRAAICAIHLLRAGVVHAFDLVWAAIEANERFAASFFDILARGAHGSAGTRLIENTSDNRLADMYLMLARRKSEVDQPGTGTLVSSQRARMMFEIQIISHLVQKGTPAAGSEIRRLADALPERDFRPYVINAKEVLLRTTWSPLTPFVLIESLRLAAQVPLSNDKTFPHGEPKKPNRKAGRSSPNYGKIDAALRAIADANPRSHSEVFSFLDDRAPIPDAEPFKTAKGWSAGFRSDRAKASSWLSTRWSILGLSAFRRGPK